MTTSTTRRRLGLAALTLTALAALAPGAGDAASARPASEPAATSQVRPATVLGHHGAGAVTLGDSAREVREAGGRVLGRPGDGCRGFVLPGREERPNRVDGYLAPGTGVVAVFARPGMRTTEGVRLGSSRAHLERAYPQLEDGSNASSAEVGPHVSYLFLLEDRRVTEISIVDDRQPCFG